MHLEIDIQNASSYHRVPAKEIFYYWLNTALNNIRTSLMGAIEISIRVVDTDEIQVLNRHYRQLDKPTNILSFTADLPPDIQPRLLGDLVICAPIVVAEAIDLGKNEQLYWAHMVIHGLLHLLGYDHIDENEAIEMEALEAELLAIINEKTINMQLYHNEKHPING
jgi:probable rRNA maturation factor